MKFLSEYENVVMDLILIEKVKHSLKSIEIFFYKGS